MTGADLVVTRWGARFAGRVFPCATGRGGIGVKAGEGDGITPAGVHRITEILVRSDRLHLQSKVAQREIGPRDGWSDDPGDPAYNTRVSRPHVFSHERLARPDPLYDLIAVLDWNAAPVAAGRGSAIFLHVWRKPRHPTAGCIAFAHADLVWILARWAQRGCVIVG